MKVKKKEHILGLTQVLSFLKSEYTNDRRSLRSVTQKCQAQHVKQHMMTDATCYGKHGASNGWI